MRYCWILMLFCLANLSGCTSSNKDHPKTYPVQGKVLKADGQPFPGGTVQFRSPETRGLTTLGDIDQEGKFSLRTISGSDRLEGAAPGIYEVTVTASSQDQTKGVPEPIVLSKKYEIQASTNEVVIQLGGK